MTAGGESLPALCVLTAPGRAPRQAAEDARALVEAGVAWVQLRVKEGGDREILSAATDLVREFPAGARLTLNDRVDLALAAGIRSVHLGDRDLPAAVARRLLGRCAEIGVSTHGAEEAIAAADGEADLIALGPIFESSTKPGARRPLGVEEVARASSRCAKPLVVIGGITEASFDGLFTAGAAAVALIGEVWSARDPMATAAFLARAAEASRAAARARPR